MNACAFDFYAQEENWQYLPDGVVVIVFPNTIFLDPSGIRCVRYLYRNGAMWGKDDGCGLLEEVKFGRHCRVAVLGPEVQKPVV